MAQFDFNSIPYFPDEFLNICESVVLEVGMEKFIPTMNQRYPQYKSQLETFIEIYTKQVTGEY